MNIYQKIPQYIGCNNWISLIRDIVYYIFAKQYTYKTNITYIKQNLWKNIRIITAEFLKIPRIVFIFDEN